MRDGFAVAPDLTRNLSTVVLADRNRHANGHSKTLARVERILPAARARLITVPSRSHVVDAARLLSLGTANLVIVCDDAGRLAGIVTKTDIVRQIGKCRGCACDIPVEAVMVPNAFCCEPGDLLEPVWSAMKTRGFREAPVLDGTGRPLGIISARDALAALLEEVTCEEELLRDYVMSNGYR